MLDSYYFDQSPRGTWRMRMRWAGAGLLVTLLHGAVIWLAVSWKDQAEAAEPAQGMVIELAALAIEPENIEPAPPPEMAKAEPQTEPVEETASPAETMEPPVPEPEPVVEAPVPPTAQPSDVVMAPPKPKVEAKPQDVKPPKVTPKPVREVKPKERKREVKQTRTERQERLDQRHEQGAQSQAAAARAAASQARAAAPIAAPAPVSGAAMASWRGSLIAHLNRHKRFPAGAHGTGAASVAFTIDRSGRVLSSSLVRSSGDTALDGEAVAMMRRASPVPQPPDGVGGRTISLAVPVRFNR